MYLLNRGPIHAQMLKRQFILVVYQILNKDTNDAYKRFKCESDLIARLFICKNKGMNILSLILYLFMFIPSHFYYKDILWNR